MVRTLFAALILAVIGGSAAFAEDAPLPPVISAGQEMPAVSGGGLTLAAAITRALAHSPRIQSFGAARRVAQGERQQAALWQNPELGIEAENFAGQDNYRGFDSAEITYGISQLVEIGGKRDARVAIAERSIELADRDEQAARLDLIRDVTQAFATTAAAYEEVKLAEEQQNLASEVLEFVTQRVNAAREPLIQKSKANVAVASSRIARDKAQRDYAAATNALANLIGDGIAITTVDAALFYAVAPLSIPESSTALANNPDITRWRPALGKSEAALALENANAVPDPRVNVGVRDFRDTDSKAFIVGLSIPIPILNGNEGNIAKARAEVTKSRVDRKTSELSLNSEFVKSAQAQQAAYNQAMTLRDLVLPEAGHAFGLARQGYQAGKFAYLEVLDAQRTLTDARLQYVEALKEYHIQRANVERLTATHLQAAAQPEEHHD